MLDVLLDALLDIFLNVLLYIVKSVEYCVWWFDYYCYCCRFGGTFLSRRHACFYYTYFIYMYLIIANTNNRKSKHNE